MYRCIIFSISYLRRQIESNDLPASGIKKSIPKTGNVFDWAKCKMSNYILGQNGDYFRVLYMYATENLLRFMRLENIWHHGSLTRYAKLWVAHVLGMTGSFPCHRLQRKPQASDPGMHHGTCGTHGPWCMSGSLTRGCGENVPGIPGACMRNPKPWYWLYKIHATFLFVGFPPPEQSLYWEMMNT